MIIEEIKCNEIKDNQNQLQKFIELPPDIEQYNEIVDIIPEETDSKLQKPLTFA